MYNGDNVNETVNEFIKRTGSKIEKKYEFILHIIADEKNQLKEPYVKHFTIEKYRQLYELRLKTAKIMVRIIYYKANDNIILLHAFYKKIKKIRNRHLNMPLRL